MKRTGLGLLLLWMMVLVTLSPSVAGAQRYRTLSVEKGPSEGSHQAFLVVVKGRAEANQPFYLLRVEQPVAQVILFPGGKGNIGVSARGIARQGNFLVRSRGLFADQGFNVAVMDVPSDRISLQEFRNDFEHKLDIAAVITHLNSLSPAPIWLVGTSRGTISAAFYAGSPRPDQVPQGLVLTSSIVWPRRDRSTVHKANLGVIRIPTLVAHHRQDGCRATKFEDVPRLMKGLSQASPLELAAFDGGDLGNGDQPCNGRSHHGFLGIEPEVVSRIGEWIKANSG